MSYDNLWDGGTNHAGTVYDNMTQWRIKCEDLYSDRDIWTPTATRYFPLGAIAESRDGRRWRYCQAGTTALTLARLQQSPAQDAQQIAQLAQTAYGASVGAKTLDVLCTTGNAMTASDLIDGWMLVGDGGATSMGQMYLIKDNKWTTSDTVMHVEIADQGGIRVAIAATDDIAFLQNQYKGLIVTTESPAGNIVGVTMTAVTASYFFWAQTRGPCAVMIDVADTIVVGDPVMASVDNTAASDGTVALVDASADDFIVGNCMMTGATSECSIIDLRLE